MDISTVLLDRQLSELHKTKHRSSDQIGTWNSTQRCISPRLQWDSAFLLAVLQQMLR